MNYEYFLKKRGELFEKSISQAERASCQSEARASEAESKRKFLAGEFDSVFSKITCRAKSYPPLRLLIPILIHFSPLLFNFALLLGLRQHPEFGLTQN